MKKSLLIFFLIFSFIVINKSYSQFTSGNIVVLRLGNGQTALTNAATPVFLDEYTPAGVFVQTVSLPIVQSGANFKFTNSGSATSEGALTLSPNGAYLCFAGYDADTGTTGVASNATFDRVIARVDKQGNVKTNTKIPQSEGYAANNIRGAVTLDGNAFWTSGTGTGGGVRYIALGSITGSIQISRTITNVRIVNIFNGQLYISSATGTYQGISTVGTGLPTDTGKTISLLNGFPSASGPSSYAFSVNPTGDTIYVADDRATASGGGVQKWILSSGTWTLAYTLNTNLTAGCRGLTVKWSAGKPVIYAVTAETTQRIVKVVDSSSASGFTELVSTPGTNKVFRGIAFAPYTTITDITNISSLPGNFDLKQNYPNPFNPETNIQYTLPEAGYVTLKVYNSLGAEVKSLVNEQQSGGTFSVKMNGSQLSSGVYYYKLNFVNSNGKFYSSVRKLMLIK